jgi:cytochrome c oxidase subunit III
MPGSTVLEELELIIEDIGGGGKLPPRDDGDDGGGDGDRWRRASSPVRRYSIGIGLAMVSILVFFLGLAVAFVVLERFNSAWVPVQLPRILWANTIVLLASSVTLELARRSLADFNLSRFQILWRITTALGVLFLVGQVIAWRELVDSRVFLNSTQASSFFYIFTGAHGVHLLGGICALLYVSLRKFEQAKVSRRAASQVASYYWHFMDGLWVLLFALLNFGR